MKTLLDVNNNNSEVETEKWGKLSGAEERDAWRQRSVPARGRNSLRFPLTAFFQAAPSLSPRPLLHLARLWARL